MLIRVPKAEHVFIMGSQGQHLSEIMAVTGVVVSVPPLNSPSEDILLHGDEAQIGMALQLMFMKSRALAMQMSSALPYQHAHGQYQNAQILGCSHGKYQNVQVVGQSHGQYQIAQVVGQSHEQYQNAQVVGQSHGQYQNVQVVGRSHGQYQNAQVVGQSHGQYQNVQVVGQSHGQNQNAQLVGQSHGQNLNAQVVGQSHGQNQNAQVVGQSHVQYQNAQVVGQSHGQYQNAQVVGQSHGQYQNSQVVGQSRGQNQNAQVVGQCRVQNQNAQVVGQSHGQNQNAQVVGQSHGQNQNAQVVGQSHGQNQNAQVVGQSHGQNQYFQIIGQSRGYFHSRGHGQYQTSKDTVLDLRQYHNQPAVGHSQSPEPVRYDNHSQLMFVGNIGHGFLAHGAPNFQPGYNVNPLMLMLTPDFFFTLQNLPVRVIHGGISSANGKSGSRKVVFKEYLSTEEVSRGLKNGTIVQGSIRINPRNFEEAYLSHPDGKSDIFIGGLSNRNRALNGDEVAVQILDEGEWMINKDELESLESSSGEDDQDSRDSETEVECEEEFEAVESKSSTLTKLELSGIGKKETEKGQKQPADNKSKVKQPKLKRYISLNDLKASQATVYRNLLTEQGEDGVKKISQRAGRVVAIIKKKHSRTCMGFIEPMNQERALFTPTDRRTTRVMIPLSNCPKDFLTRPKDHEKTLYICRITEWKRDSVYAEGHLVKGLGDGEEIEPVTEGILIENNVDVNEFPKEAIDSLPKISPWTIPFEEFEYRRDYRSSCVFTIDPATARDLDDALSCEDLGDGMFKVGVHIADVSFFVKENSILDKVASQRSTSVYLVQKMIPMLPRLLCEQLCSLNPDEDRLTLSVEWIITEHGEKEERKAKVKADINVMSSSSRGFCRKRRNAKEPVEKEEERTDDETK